MTTSTTATCTVVTGKPAVTSTTIPWDACICDGKVSKPRRNCWATNHNLKVAR